MMTQNLTAKFGLIDFARLATAKGQAEVEKRMKAVRPKAKALFPQFPTFDPENYETERTAV